MLQPLVGLVLAVVGAVFLHQSLLMTRVPRDGLGTSEPATVTASELVNDGHATDVARRHYTVTTRLALGDSSAVVHTRGFTSEPEARRHQAVFAPGARVPVRRTGLSSPAVLLEGERLEPGFTAGMGGLALAVGLGLLWAAWRDWRLLFG